MAEDAVEGYVEHILEHFGSPLDGLRIAVDCANGAFSAIAPGVFERLGAQVTTVAAAPDGTNINVGCGATDLALLQDVVRSGDYDLGVAFDGDGDRMLAVDETGAALDGDQILAVLALALGVDTVAVTTMTNLGFHRLMAERGVRVLTTDVGDRHVLAAMRAEGAVLGGEQSGHVISLDGHVTGDGLAAALLLCRAIHGGSLSAAAAVLELLPQAKQNVPVARRDPHRRRTPSSQTRRASSATGSCSRPFPWPDNRAPRRSMPSSCHAESTLAPRPGATAMAGGRAMAWTAHQTFAYYIDFRESFDKTGGEYVVGYAVAYINAPAAMEVTLALSTNDQGKAWLNGKQVFAFEETRVLERDTDRIPVSLVQGQNVLVLKVLNEVNSWQACVRFLRGETPVTNLEIALVPK